MKKSLNWKKEYGIFEPSKEEIEYLESYQGKEVTFDDIIASSKRKSPNSLQKQVILTK